MMMMKKSSPNHHRKSSRAKKNKGKEKKVEPEAAPKPRAKGRSWTKVEEEALAIVFVKASTCPIETTKRVVVFGIRQRIDLTRLWSMVRLVISNPSRASGVK
ncbi:hypothetical protein Hanom_Chr09g00852201 [Helianthus anomalus]